MWEKINKLSGKFIKSKELVISLVLLIVIELFAFFSVDSDLHLYFFDIGQGDSVLIKTPSYRYILIDGGESDLILEELGEVLPFWTRRIDVVIGTHADSDHIGGLVYVLEKYEVNKFITSDLDADDDNLRKIKDITSEKDIDTTEFDAGDEIDIGGVNLDCLWPGEDFETENDNQNSIVLKGEYQEFSFLLTGDIEADQEELILQTNSNIQSEVLKASHHGSKTATSDSFLKAVSPTYIVISCGLDNKFGHPAEEILERINNYQIDILRTDLDGRIEFISDGEILTVELER